MSRLVSVLLPVYTEDFEWVKGAINSIIGQTYAELEIIVGIDKPGRNDVTEWLEYVDDKRIVYYINDENLGLVNNLNKGLELCHGEFIARMDADDISMPNRIEEELCFLEENNYDIVGSNVLKIDDHGNVIGESAVRLKAGKVEGHLRRLGSIPHPTWFAKRDVFEKLNGYRDIPLAEDYDFLIRAYLIGFKIGSVNERLLEYRQNLNGITQTDKGKQRVIAMVLREQVTKRTVYDVREIERIVSNEGKLVEKYRNYYAYSRYIRRAICRDDEIKMKKIFGFRLYYLFCFIRDINLERFGMDIVRIL